ncbi:MAG: diguanylate cyclase, partial [Deltaproteobacteria bacterium]
FCYDQKSSLYKLPSDEFALLTLQKITTKKFYKDIELLIDKLRDTHINVAGHEISISIRSGISSNKAFLLPTADMALQASKHEQNEIVIYDNSIDKTISIQENIEVISIIKHAINNNEITPYFQPIFNVHTNKIEKYEALVRIVQKDGTILAPYKFLNIAIKSKLYPNITRIMIEKTFAFFIDKDYEFSINLSIDDVLNKKTKQFLIKKLKQFPTPSRVVFEILESEKIENYEELREFIKTIKKFGCKFAIDDFGSGYSNFAHILELNVDYLKIDASLVKFITTNENSRVITKTIINFASSLGLKTIAEFVEDKDSLDMLEKMGVNYVQGYYIGKPQNKLNTTF